MEPPRKKEKRRKEERRGEKGFSHRSTVTSNNTLMQRDYRVLEVAQ